MKKSIFAFVGVAILATASVYGVVRLAAGSHLHDKEADAETATVHCDTPGTMHTVTITHNAMNPQHLTAKACDRFSVVNSDDVTRLIAFGKHDHHQAYDGVTEKILTKDQSLTVTLDELGDYTFHDHLHDELVGELTVVK